MQIKNFLFEYPHCLDFEFQNYIFNIISTPLRVDQSSQIAFPDMVGIN